MVSTESDRARFCRTTSGEMKRSLRVPKSDEHRREQGTGWEMVGSCDACIARTGKEARWPITPFDLTFRVPFLRRRTTHKTYKQRMYIRTRTIERNKA